MLKKYDIKNEQDEINTMKNYKENKHLVHKKEKIIDEKIP